MPRPRKAVKDNRTVILNAAERLFIERGYEDTSVNAILAEANLSKGTFYYYYRKTMIKLRFH